MATVEKAALRGERRVLLSDISWAVYEQLRGNKANWRVRMAYDNGRLELMSPPEDHESITELIGELIKAFTEELGIYAALGVPEIWRWRRNGLTAYALNRDGKYVERELSMNLPMLRVKDLEPFLDFDLAADETTWIRNFRKWVCEKFLRDNA